MTKITLLQMTQDILSNLSSDEVNSISDTPESLQVATIIKQKYYDIVSRGDLPEHSQLFQLTPSTDATQPALMFLPDGIGHVNYIKYFNSNALTSATSGSSIHGTNLSIQTSPVTFTSVTSNTIGLGNLTFTVSANLAITANESITITATPGNSMSGKIVSYLTTSLVVNITSFSGSGTFSAWTFVAPGSGAGAPPGYQYVNMLSIPQFLQMTNSLNPTSSNVSSFLFSDTSNNFPGNFTFYFRTDKQPQYCCILSNYYVIFDSYDNTQDTTLQSSKTMCYGEVVPSFLMVDSFIPDLDSQQFPLLINEAKALAFYELKQQPHVMAAQEVKRQWSTVQKNKSINNRPKYFDELPDFGRYGRGYQSASSPFKQRGWDR